MSTGAFARAVDAIGGVEADVPFDMHYDDPAQGLHIHLEKGRQRLDGKAAEQFLRYRSGYATGDLGRVDARSGFLRTVLSQVKEKMTAASAAKIAAERGIPIFVDAAPASDGVELDTLPPIEIFSPNETETEKYTGISPVGTENSIRAALALYRTVKCKYVVIKQGARGAFLYDGKKYATFPAVRPDKVVDTTGAGDAFTAALTVEYMRCGDIHRAINFANCAGAIAVSRVGASSAVPTYGEVLELYSKTKFY
jgi:sugar/nucleoside kinase (ribokinase family)